MKKLLVALIFLAAVLGVARYKGLPGPPAASHSHSTSAETEFVKEEAELLPAPRLLPEQRLESKPVRAEVAKTPTEGMVEPPAPAPAPPTLTRSPASEPEPVMVGPDGIIFQRVKE